MRIKKTSKHKMLTEFEKIQGKEAEPREITLGRALKSGQPIEGDTRNLHYGMDDEAVVIAGTDIRMDRMELAQEAMAKMTERQRANTKNPALKESAGTGERVEGSHTEEAQ